MNWEKLFYEIKPIIYLAIGATALFYRGNSKLYLVVGLILLLIGSVVFTKRTFNRSAERMFYDIKPFIYIALALVTLFFFNESKVGVGSAMILLFCASVILRWRSH